VTKYLPNQIHRLGIQDVHHGDGAARKQVILNSQLN